MADFLYMNKVNYKELEQCLGRIVRRSTSKKVASMLLSKAAYDKAWKKYCAANKKLSKIIMFKHSTKGTGVSLHPK